MQAEEEHMQRASQESLAAGQAVLEAQQHQATLCQQISPAIHAPIPHVPQKIPTPLQLDLAATLQQAVSQQEQQTGLQFLQQPPALDPQAYAQQVLRNQDLLLAQAGSSLEPAFDPQDAPIPVSQSSTPTPYQQYNTPPMQTAAQFQQDQPAQKGDTDMLDAPLHNYTSSGLGASQGLDPSQHGMPLQASQIQQVPPATLRQPHPGNLDFTTLRGPGSNAHMLATGAIKEDQPVDGLITSPYASSALSTMSSFPFSSTIGTNTGTSVTSGSRSRATSLSKSTSAARSRAPSHSSVGPNGISNPYSFAAPDAHELEHILGSLTTLPSPINEDEDDYFNSYYENAEHAGTTGEDPAFPSVKGNSPYALPTALPGKGPDALDQELADRFQDVFTAWLPRVCSDIEATDKRGEKIHQPLMAKRMAKLDEEHAFRPFKFRIQPFTLAFQDACRDVGMSESDSAIKHVRIRAYRARQYADVLWHRTGEKLSLESATHLSLQRRRQKIKVGFSQSSVILFDR